MTGFSADSFLLTSLLWIAILLSVAALIFLILAVTRHDWGNAATVSAMLVIAVFGWIFSLQEGYINTGGNPQLEITDKIEITGGGNLYLNWVLVENRGSGSAKNCAVEIEHSGPGETEFTYLGYAFFNNARFPAYTQSKLVLVKAISYDQGKHWETSIMTKDVRDYIKHQNDMPNIIPYSVIPGEHQLKLRILAENGQSSSRIFRLYVSPEETTLPKLEAIKQEQTSLK